jgi:quinol monooxygenase YgiN
VSFIQVIDMYTKNFDEIQALDEEWLKATEGKRTLRKAIIARDRNHPSHYVVFAFFDSYESAMINSNMHETNEFGEKQNALLEGPMQFTDLDIIEEH